MAGYMDIGRLVATLGLNSTPFMAGMNKAQAAMVTMGRAMTRFVTLPTVLAGGAAVNTQKKFEASMTKIIGLVGVSRKVVEGWNKEVLKMAMATGRGPEELADALYFVASAGIRGKEALEVLEMSAKASAVGLGDTKIVADLVTSAINAYGKENLNAAQATDILVAAVREGKAEADELAGAMGMVLPIASEYGVTFDQVGAAFAGMTRTGTNARVASTQLKAILSAMASPSKQAADAMARFDYSAEQFRKTIREQGLIQALLDLREITKGNEEAMADVFPNIRALMGTLDLLGANVEYNVQIFDALKNATGSLDRAFQEIGGTTEQKLNVAMAALKVTFVQFGDVVKPFVVTTLTGLHDRLSTLATTFSTMSESQKKTTFAVVKLTAAFGPFLLVLSRVITMIRVASLTTLIGAFVTLTGVLSAYLALRQTANKIEKQSAEQRSNVIRNASKEIISAQQLFEKLGKLTKGSKEWNAVRIQINSKYGDYLTNLIKEKSTQEELATALAEVTKARYNDALAQGYKEEATRLQEEEANNFIKGMKRWIKVVEENTLEWDEASQKFVQRTGKLPADFMTAMQTAIDKANQARIEGIDYHKVAAQFREDSENIYKEFIGSIEEDARPVFTQIGGYFADDFQKAALKSLASKKQVDITVGLIPVAKPTQGIDNTEALKRNKEEIQYMKDVAQQAGEQVDLQALIQLYKKRSVLLTGELNDATGELKIENQAIITDLENQYRIQRDILSSLGDEAILEGNIAQLKKDRKKLSGAELVDNSKKLNDAERELEILQVQTSALNDQAKMAEMITIRREQLKTLSGQELENSIKQLQSDQLQLALESSKLSGLNEEEQLKQRITAYQEYGASLDGDALKANKALVESMRQELTYKQALSDGADRLTMLEIERNDLMLQRKKLSIEEQAVWTKSIAYIDEEIAKEKDRLAGLSDIKMMENEIARMEKAKDTMQGSTLEKQKEAIFNKQLELFALKKQLGALTDIEKVQLAIVELEILRLKATDPEEAAKLEAELQAKKQELDDLGGVNIAGLAFETKGSKEWFASLNKGIELLKATRQQMEVTYGKDSNQYKTANKNLKAALGEKLGAYSDYFETVLNGASMLASAMTNLIEGQKQRELSAAGDNAKQREAIEKRYFQKQKRWALAQAAIDTAAAAIAALRNPVPGLKWIDFAAVLTAGAIQIATISAQSFAKGGIVYGETLARVGEYPGASSNPEVIAPLSDLKALLGRGDAGGLPKTILLRANGRELQGVINMEELLQNTY